MSGRNRSRRKTLLILVAFVIGGALLTTAIPRWLASAQMRERILRRVIDDPGWTITSDSASFGWSTPLSVSGLKLTKRDQSVDLTADQLIADRSWWSLVLSPDDIGKWRVINPKLVLVLAKDSEANAETSADLTPFPDFQAEIRNGHLQLYDDSDGNSPAVDIENQDLVITLGGPGEIRSLSVEHWKVLRSQTVTQELVTEGLKLITPLLVGEVDLSGNVSLEITEIQIPVDLDPTALANEITIKGTANLNACEATLTNPTTRRLVEMFSELMELGPIPDRVRLTDDTQWTFELGNGEIQHVAKGDLLPGLTSGFFVEIAGSVSLEEEIDLLLTIQLPIELLGDGELSRQVATTPIEIAVVGSLAEPKLRLDENATWPDTLTPAMSLPDLDERDRELAQDLRTLIESLREN